MLLSCSSVFLVLWDWSENNAGKCYSLRCRQYMILAGLQKDVQHFTEKKKMFDLLSTTVLNSWILNSWLLKILCALFMMCGWCEYKLELIGFRGVIEVGIYFVLVVGWDSVGWFNFHMAWLLTREVHNEFSNVLKGLISRFLTVQENSFLFSMVNWCLPNSYYWITTKRVKLCGPGFLTQSRLRAHSENTLERRILADSISLFSLKRHTHTHASVTLSHSTQSMYAYMDSWLAQTSIVLILLMLVVQIIQLLLQLNNKLLALEYICQNLWGSISKGMSTRWTSGERLLCTRDNVDCVTCSNFHLFLPDSTENCQIKQLRKCDEIYKRKRNQNPRHESAVVIMLLI